MKKIFKEIVIFLVILLIVTNVISYIRKPNLETNPIANLTLTTIDSKKIDLDAYRGKPFVLHFWATWCPTCKLELSNIDFISKDYKVITIAVNSGSNEEIREFMRKRDMNFNVINDTNSKISNKFLVEAFPTTFIFNSSGEIIFSEVGYTSTAGLIARLKWADKK